MSPVSLLLNILWIVLGGFWMAVGATQLVKQVLDDLGMGSIAFTALAQGMLTDRFTSAGRAASQGSSRPSFSADAADDPKVVERIDALAAIARRRGQTLAQLALAWVLRTATSTLVGASSVRQLEENLKTLDNLDFDAEELAEIDRYAVDESAVDNWRAVSES